MGGTKDGGREDLSRVESQFLNEGSSKLLRGENAGLGLAACMQCDAASYVIVARIDSTRRKACSSSIIYHTLHRELMKTIDIYYNCAYICEHPIPIEK